MAISPSINTNNITLGKGEVFFGADRNTYLPFGLLKNGQLNIKSTTQILKDSSSGINVPAFVAPIGIEATAKITVAELSLDNLQRFLLAQAPAAANQIGGTVSAQVVTARVGALIQLQAVISGVSTAIKNISTATKPVVSGAVSVIDATADTVTVSNGTKTFTRASGSFITDGFEVGQEVTTTNFTNSGNNATFKISALTALIMTVTKVDGTAATLTAETNTTITNLTFTSGVYVEGVDYTVNYERGLIKILPTGNIIDGQIISIGFTYLAFTNQTLLSHTQAIFEGHFMYVGNSPYGTKLNLYGYGIMTPNGSLNFADGDAKPIEMAFDLTFIPNAAYPAGSLIFADTEVGGVD
ncbi:MAG: hypothetical protein HQK93_03410 [Nitrospirae bacterium]|nr:hypothetical protein [Nitrospirota bacterium]